MTNEESAQRLGAWVRERAQRAELGEGARAWLATGPTADERPPASVMCDLLVALSTPEARRLLDRGELDTMADEADDAMLETIRRVVTGARTKRVE